MIKIIICNSPIILQQQLKLNEYPSRRIVIKFKEYPKVGITYMIRYYFRKKDKAKKALNHQISIKSYRQLSLEESIRRSFSIEINLVVAIRKIVHKNITQNQNPRPIKYLTQISLEKWMKTENKALIEGENKFIDRFYPIPSVKYEDFCQQLNLKEDWILFQEVPTYRGTFQHLAILNNFDYWDNIEDEIRNLGYHPKGFKVKELVLWDLLRNSSGKRFYSQFNTDAMSWD